MDAVGVDKTVLHASLPTNRYYGRVARAYPGRFLPVAYLPYEEDVDVLVAALTTAVDDGMVGLYQNPLPGWGGFNDFHTPRYDALWREVERRKLPVYTMGWVSAAADYAGIADGVYTPKAGHAGFVRAGRRLRRHAPQAEGVERAEGVLRGALPLHARERPGADPGRQFAADVWLGVARVRAECLKAVLLPD
jgi:hypothetical protein